jgi:hypothetical protein
MQSVKSINPFNPVNQAGYDIVKAYEENRNEKKKKTSNGV